MNTNVTDINKKNDNNQTSGIRTNSKKPKATINTFKKNVLH